MVLFRLYELSALLVETDGVVDAVLGAGDVFVDDQPPQDEPDDGAGLDGVLGFVDENPPELLGAGAEGFDEENPPELLDDGFDEEKPPLLDERDPLLLDEREDENPPEEREVEPA